MEIEKRSSNISWELPPKAREFGEDYFSDATIKEAQKLLTGSKVSISFTKGNLESFFICSGIIEDNQKYEAKVTFKNILKDTAEGPISSYCHCHKWTKEDHCSHSCALFFNFYLSLLGNKNLGFQRSTPNSIIPFSSSRPIIINSYGTIIEPRQFFQGNWNKASYSALQYVLSNKKTVNFPIPENWDGKLVVDITSPAEGEGAKIVFKHQRTEGPIDAEISIFESLYLFNWNSGRAYHLPRQLKDLMQRIRPHSKRVDVNDVLMILESSEAFDLCEIIIDGKSTEEIPHLKTSCRIYIDKGTRKGQIQMGVTFYNDNDVQVPVPELLNSFTFSGGYLDSFKTKNNAYDFIEEACASYQESSDHYKKYLASSSSKHNWGPLIHHNRSYETISNYDSQSRSIVRYDCALLFEILSSLYCRFGKPLFRLSECDRDLMTTRYQLPQSVLFEKLSEFYEDMLKVGTQIYYNRIAVRRWSSKIRFERKSHHIEWFDLELSIPDSDMQIVEKADLEGGTAMTTDGLVLLTKEHRDLVKFIKRYTAYENEAHFSEEGDDGDKLNKFILPFKKARIFELFELRKLGIEGALTQEEVDLCYQLETMVKMPVYEIPESFEKVLRPYQKTGYNWLRFLYKNRLGACLADDMGLGKTIQTIAFIKSVYDQIDKALVVCPVTILLNWEKEFAKFSDIPIAIYHGSKRNLADISGECKVILTSYGVMKKEVNTTFKGINFDILILDEVQHLKNIRSLGAYAARNINADFRITLTGTPVENDLVEFYNILDLSIPGVWGDLSMVRTISTKNTRLLARRTASPFILRRTKSQVLQDLPPKIENNIFLTFSDEEEKNYNQTLTKIRQKIKNATSRNRYGEILCALLELRQKCLWQSPTKITNKQVISNIDSITSTKIKFLTETLEQIIEEGHQAIVFSQFTTYLNIIEQRMLPHHWRIARIDGRQTTAKRQRQVDLFQEGKCPVFLISLKAGGVGLNLTAASYVFVMDPWWNPSVEQQAIDRAHRIGQRNPLTVYRPIIKGSVEEKVLELQRIKKELFFDLLPDDDNSLFTGKINMTDLEELFT